MPYFRAGHRVTAIPRRTIRMSDAEWAAGHTKAQANGETLTEVLRRLLSAYLADDVAGLDGYTTEYRAIPRGADESLAVGGISGPYDVVRRLFPAKHWFLEERTVSPYGPASRRSV